MNNNNNKKKPPVAEALSELIEHLIFQTPLFSLKITNGFDPRKMVQHFGVTVTFFLLSRATANPGCTITTNVQSKMVE